MPRPLLRASLAALLPLALLVSGPPVAARSATYTVTDLGTLPGGSTSSASAVNDAEQVVGLAGAADGAAHAVLWQDGDDPRDLGSLGGYSFAFGINNTAQVVGASRTAGAASQEHAFLWQDATGMRDLGTLGGRYPGSQAAGINDSGVVTGHSSTPTGRAAFVWQEGSGMRALPSLGGNTSFGKAINNRGDVAGGSFTPNGQEHAVLWQNGAEPRDLGTLGGPYPGSRAFGINNAGAVVGSADVGRTVWETHAFLWTAGAGMRDLGSLDAAHPSTRAYSVNEAGDIVGTASYRCRRHCDDASRAFLYRDGQMMDLNGLIPGESGLVLTQAESINAAGQIVGAGRIGGETHAFLLTPQDADEGPTGARPSPGRRPAR